MWAYPDPWLCLQTKGKAAIDVVCNPLGKSGGSLIQQVMIIAFGSLAASTPYLGVILMGIVIIWILAANSLSKQVPFLRPPTPALPGAGHTPTCQIEQ